MFLFQKVKEQQVKCRESRRKEIIKMRTENNREESMKPKDGSLKGQYY